MNLEFQQEQYMVLTVESPLPTLFSPIFEILEKLAVYFHDMLLFATEYNWQNKKVFIKLGVLKTSLRVTNVNLPF